MGWLEPMRLAWAQMGDRAFLGVVLLSVIWSGLAFVGLAAGLGWWAHGWLATLEQGWLAWLGPMLGVVVAGLLALVLFLPLAMVVASLFVERIADAVERRFYPGLPAAAAAAMTQQAWDGVALGLRVLGLQVLALVAALLLPGVGLILGWAIAAWAIGRGLFVAVAMRRMDRAAAHSLYRSCRGAVLTQGALIAAAGLVPGLNLLVAVLGTAAMVHVLHREVVHRQDPATRRGGL